MPDDDIEIVVIEPGKEVRREHVRTEADLKKRLGKYLRKIRKAARKAGRR